MPYENDRVEFTAEMKKTYKILFPNMLPITFRILAEVFGDYGYDVELLTNSDRSIVDEGLKYVHNDTCYPALLVIGQMICALKSGKYDVDRTALMMTQTGGGCRASNYIFLLRKALKKAGFGQVPVISINTGGLEKNSGFKPTLPMLKKVMAAIAYGDALMLVRNQTKPYERNPGEADLLVDKWITRLSESFSRGESSSVAAVSKRINEIVRSFEKIEKTDKKKVKVGIVGEIYVKYSSVANNDLVAFLESEGCEVMVPGLIGFLLYCSFNGIEDYKLYSGSGFACSIKKIIYDYLAKYEKMIIDAVRKTGIFTAPATNAEIRHMVENTIGLGCKMGEGWLLTAEMIELCHSGYENIVCVQPFGCLPNHIVGKGMVRKIRQTNENANIVTVDYDPGATKVNQENRIKLMLSVSRERVAEEKAEEKREKAGEE